MPSPAADSKDDTAFCLPESISLIVLDECYLFPGCMLPLYIFEQRYRDMLAHALETSRMFCVGTLSEGRLLPVSTAGLIRACKQQKDGSSHVMLFGVKRIQFDSWEQEKPFRIAKISPFPTEKSMTDSELYHLKAQAMHLLAETEEETSEPVQMLKNILEEMDDPELACDILSYHFIRNAEAVKTLLLEPSLLRRYQILLGELERIKNGGSAENPLS
jgi:Lon protease-like protein